MNSPIVHVPQLSHSSYHVTFQLAKKGVANLCNTTENIAPKATVADIVEILLSVDQRNRLLWCCVKCIMVDYLSRLTECLNNKRVIYTHRNKSCFWCYIHIWSGKYCLHIEAVPTLPKMEYVFLRQLNFQGWHSWPSESEFLRKLEKLTVVYTLQKENFQSSSLTSQDSEPKQINEYQHLFIPDSLSLHVWS